MSKKPKRTCAIKIASSDKPVFESMRERFAEDDGLAPDAVEPDPEYVEKPEAEPAPLESEEQLHSDMVRLVLERIEVKEAASESAKTFRRKIEAIDAQVESIARRLDTMGLVETFERVAECPSCGLRHEWQAPYIDSEGSTVLRLDDDVRVLGIQPYCLQCEPSEAPGEDTRLTWGDILVVRRRPNGELVDTRPVLASETQLALGVES